MTYEDLIRNLRAKKALIVHFSHHAKMRQDGVFPADLHAAIANSRAWPLSCSVVWPGHGMPVVGSVGVVLHPRSLASVVGASNQDAGSMTLPDGTENGRGTALDANVLADTLNPPSGQYNEWRMRECDVIGIYVENLGEILAKKTVVIEAPDIDPTSEISAEPRTLTEVTTAFPELPIYTFQAGEIVAVRVPPSVVYPWPVTSPPAPTRP